MTVNPWLTYWNDLPAGRLLFAPEAAEYVRNLRDAIPFTSSARVLDFGCGYGGPASLLAPHVGTLFFFDAVPSMMAAATENLKPFPNARPWDGVGPVDVILVNSVAQYLRPGELADRVREWADVLTPGGLLVLSDLTPPGHSSLSDMWSLFRFSVQRGYILRAVWNTLAERQRYAMAGKERPLTHYTDAEIERTAAEAGLGCRYLTRNLTHFRDRRTAVLTKPAA